MELTLSQNIRKLRKDRKMTQEQLAEVLGVTVGAVYKWESGLSVPELPLIVQMADFFDVSVDMLLGHKMKDNSLESVLERLTEYWGTMDPMALTEAEKALGKYPNSFQVVFYSAIVYFAFGSVSLDRNQLERSLDLLKQSRVLLVQNTDPKITEITISGAMATVLYMLGETDRCLDILKGNNSSGTFNALIGALLATHKNRPEEASGYLSEAMTDGLSSMMTSILGYVFIFRSREDWQSALDIVEWGMRILEGLITDGKTGALIRVHAQLYALLSYAQSKTGKKEASEQSLREAFKIARSFDSTPDYSLSGMRFAEHSDNTMTFDLFGSGTTDSIGTIIGLLDDKDMAERWKEITENGK